MSLGVKIFKTHLYMQSILTLPYNVSQINITT